MNAFTCISTLRIHIKIVYTDRLIYTSVSKSGKREKNIYMMFEQEQINSAVVFVCI